MSRVKSRDTGPEKLFRRALRKAAVSFRASNDTLPGKPDFVLPARRTAIFVDGDFWHGRQWKTRKHASIEGQFAKSATREYWVAKIRRNMARDLASTALLLEQGWKVARFWESDVRRDTAACVEALSQPAYPTLLADLTVAEFFAGIGLMRYALERQGWRTVFANDIDPKKQRMYAAHFGDPFHLQDVHAVDPATVPSVTLATASFPCTDLSLAGARKGFQGEHSSAFWGFLRVLDGMGSRRPPLVLVENVPGFLSSRGGADLQAALEAMNALGYSVDMFLLDAIHFVPQSRNRLFLIGQPKGERSGTRPESIQSFIDRHPRICWTVRRLPEPPVNTATLDSILEKEAPWWASERRDYLLSQMTGSHQEAAQRAIRKRRWSYGTVFRRVRNGRTVAELRMDGAAGCLRTPRGGSARQILFKAGYGRYECRLLTALECARLMGADDYSLDNVPPNQALFGFGDAVCVPVVEWIAAQYLLPLCNELIRGKLLIR